METVHWIDGARVAIAEPATLAVVNYGHFTAMQVRGGRVRGLTAHLSRVDGAHRELFGHGLDHAWVQAQWAAALAERPDASLRSTYYDDAAGAPHVMTVARAPVEPASAPQRLRSVRHIRPFAHLKHVGTFAQIRHGEEAERAGYDDALLVDDAGCIAETTMANVGFLRARRLIWPDGPMLDGIGQQLLGEAARRAGMAAERRRVSLDELGSFDGAFWVNSVGVAAIAQIDEHHFAGSADHVAPVIALHERLAWDDLTT